MLEYNAPRVSDSAGISFSHGSRGSGESCSGWETQSWSDSLNEGLAIHDCGGL